MIYFICFQNICGTYPCSDTFQHRVLRTIILYVVQRENIPPRSALGQQHVSNIALINTERAYASYAVNNDVDCIIDIFERAETAISFNVFYEHMIDNV